MRLRSFKEFEGIKESERVYAWSAPRSLVIKYTLCQHILSVPSKKVSANDIEEIIRADLARLNAIKAGSLYFTRFYECKHKGV